MKRTEKYLSLLLLTLVAAPVIAEEEAIAEHDEVVRAGAPVTMGILREHIKAVTGSGFNGQTMTNVALSELGVILNTFASATQTSDVTATGIIPFTESIDTAGIFTFGASNIAFAQPGTYAIVAQGTITSLSGGTITIAASGTAATKVPATTVLPTVTLAATSATSFSFIQVVTITTAGQTVIYTSTEGGTDATLARTNLFIIRLA